MARNSQREILISAGEASGDRYGARLVERLRAIGAGSQAPAFFGTGGHEMERAGVRLLGHASELAHIGPREQVAHLSNYIRIFSRTVREARNRRPAAAVLIDFPDFNLWMAKRLKRAGIPVVYYISPQLWAWRRYRIRAVRKYVDRMLVILPFEEEYYRQRGIAVEFVGHPLLENFAPCYDRVGFLRPLGLDPERKTVALLPGSRHKEVEYILPSLIRASLDTLRAMPAQFVISAAPTVGEEHVRRVAAEQLNASTHRNVFRIVTTASRDILANADFGFVKSGTSTLEAALVGTPFAIVYKISAASWFVGNRLIRVPHRGLVNLIAGKEVVPELMQEKATPEILSRTALEYLRQPQKAAEMKTRLAGIRQMLGAHCATETVAAVVRSYL